MPTITPEEVKHVANLARLEFNEDEIAQFTHQLGRILDYIGKLNELDTTDVPPTSHVLPISNVSKSDDVKPSYDRAEVLERAPSAEEGYFSLCWLALRLHRFAHHRNHFWQKPLHLVAKSSLMSFCHCLDRLNHLLIQAALA